MPLTNAARKRVMKDIQELCKNPLHDSGIYVRHDENDISRATAVLFGPEDTPYAHGAYLFEFNFPDNYPFTPPKAKFKTYDPAGKTRFHPNLYVEGKVCLSILGTWSGPGWTSVQTFSSVLLSIKSLLDEKPLENEPGFENTSKENNENYNGCIRYENCRVAVLYQNQHLSTDFEHFQEDIDKYYIKNYNTIRDSWLKYKEDYNKEYYSQTYSIHIKADYDKMIKGLDTMYNSLIEKYPKLAAENKVVETPQNTTNTEIPRPIATTCAVEEKKKKKKIKIIKKTS